MKPVENRKHHYVPQLLLRNFAPNKKTLFAFDKWKGRSFPVAVKDAAAEKGFYSFDAEGISGCLEDFFGEFEGPVGAIVEKILGQRMLPKLGSLEREQLCRFAVAQVLRSKNHLALWFQSGDVLRTLAEQGTPEFKAWVGPKDEEADRAHLLRGIKRQMEQFTPFFLNKDIILFTQERGSSFIIGDSPLVRSNTSSSVEEGGGLGFACKGVEIYLPLSPDVQLGFLCTTIVEGIRAAISRVGRDLPRFLFDFAFAVELNRTVPTDSPNADFYNSLQIASSERYLYSCVDDFALARRMLDGDKDFRQGRRMVTSLDEILKGGPGS